MHRVRHVLGASVPGRVALWTAWLVAVLTVGLVAGILGAAGMVLPPGEWMAFHDGLGVFVNPLIARQPPSLFRLPPIGGCHPPRRRLRTQCA